MNPALPELTDSSLAVLRRHGKSFAWAALFLPRSRLNAITELYHFCRHVDDIADHLPPDVAVTRLREVREVVTGRQAETSHLQTMVSQLKNQGVRAEWLLDLLAGVETDLKPVRDWTEAELLLYCYRVAGVVGLMMCPLLGVVDVRAHEFAVDLGIGMQLTNMARDVAEDAAVGRVYIPLVWLKELGLSSDNVIFGPLNLQQKQALVDRFLRLADLHYEKGRRGFGYIPFRPRLAIAVAARLYREIGLVLRRRFQLDPWLGRAHTTVWMKIRLTAQELLLQLNPLRRSF